MWTRNNSVAKMTKKAALLLFLATIVSLISPTPITRATTVGFEAGRIIDDIVFTNSQSMDVSQIQGFLNSKVPTCETWHTGFYGSSGTYYGPPFICLKDFKENGLTAAQIIYNAAQTHQINPQVLLVLLQKEQSLITDTWPASFQYRSATGYGCPDGAPCDAEYYGFTNQVDWASHMFRAILNVSPTWYTPYLLGNNYIQYSPNAACGGTMVNIVNRSTQSLYNYTPYQPNQAALNAGYGSGDACSAYGNRNFYNFFTDWFGSTKRDLITSASYGVYMVENGKKRPFPSEFIFLSNYNKWSNVLTISNQEMSTIPDGPVMTYNTHYRDGQLVASPSKGIYLVSNGLKRPFPNEATFLLYGGLWKNVINISDSEMSMIPKGTPVTYDTHTRDGKLVTSLGVGIYLVENGQKRPFPSEFTFLSNSFKFSDVVSISSAEISLIPNGTVMTYNPHYRDGRLVTSLNKGIFLVEDGLKRPFPSEFVFLSNSYKFSDVLTISSTEMSQIPGGEAMTYNVHYRDGKLVTSPSLGVYLVENGTKRAFPSELIFLSNQYKFSNVTSIGANEISAIPAGEVMTYNVHYRDGKLIISSSKGIYLVEDGLKRPFPSEEIFLSYSYSWSSAINVSDTEMSLIPDGTAMIAKS